MSLSGLLNVNKPVGKTSAYIVGLVRRWSGIRRVGHGGTLDPLASGVLPMGIGQGTKALEFLLESTKTYCAQIELGTATDTYDSAGRITLQADPSFVTPQLLEDSLSSFRGSLWQTPPPYSAPRYKGKHLYEWARQGVEVKVKPREVQLFRLEIKEWRNPLLTLEVECSKGTYVRSIAHELGVLLGCGAHLKSLLRLRCGPFHLEEATPLAELERAFDEGWWLKLLYPLDFPCLTWDALILSKASQDALIKGGSLPLLGETSEAGRCRAYTAEGCFLGVVHSQEDKRVWQPQKVFSPLF